MRNEKVLGIKLHYTISCKYSLISILLGLVTIASSGNHLDLC